MVYTVSITSQGQISIPAKIRKQLGVEKGGKAILTLEKKRIIVEPVADFLALRGSIKTSKPPLTSEEIHNIFATAVVEEYANKLKLAKNKKK